MCLYKTHRLPKISRKPIQVYKIFDDYEAGGALVTPYQGQVCEVVNGTIKAKHSWIKGILKNKIEGEGVHAFINKRTAKRNENYFCHVYLCEIPPFTPYWIGENDEIAASKMIIKEKV